MTSFSIVNEKRKKPYFFAGLLVMVYLVITAFFEEGVAYFDPVYTTLMSDTEFFLTFSICVIMWISIVLIGKRFFSISINWVFAIVVACLFFVDVMAICFFPTFSVSTSGVYYLSGQLKIRYIIFWLSACMAFYVFFAIMPKIVVSTEQYNIYFILCVFIAVVSTIYSYLREWPSYVSFFNPSTNMKDFHSPISFTNNKNTYGTLLLFGLLSVGYLRMKTSRKWWSLLGVYFLVNLLFVLSKAAILIGLFFSVSFLIWLYVTRLKSHPIITNAYLFFFIAVSIFTCVYLRASGNKLFSRIIQDIPYYFSGQFDSLASRADIWESAFGILDNPLRLFFGIGDWNFSYYLGFDYSSGTTYIESAHSGLVDVFCRFGICGFLIFISMLIFYFFLLANSFKHKRSSAFVNLLIFICVFSHGFVEDTNFLNMQAKSMLSLFMVFMPLLCDWNRDRQGDSNDWILDYSTTTRSSFCHLPFSRIDSFLYLFFVPFLSCFCGLFPLFQNWYGITLSDSLLFGVLSCLMILVLPETVYCLTIVRNKLSSLLFASSIFLIVVLSLSFPLALFLFHSVVACIVLFALLCSLFLCLVFPIRKIFFKKTWSTMLLFSLMFFFLFGFNRLLSCLLIIPSEVYEPYALICLSLFNIFFVVFAACCTHADRLFFGGSVSNAKFEAVFYRYLLYVRLKDEIKVIKETKNKLPFRSL
jgi:hypothetical protein